MTSIEREPLPVMLSIRGEQYFDGIDPDAQELMTEGTMTLTEDGMVLAYEETALTGMEGTTTRFQIRGPRVILTRSETPFGELSVDIQTSVLKHNLTERGGLMEIKYSIAVEHTVTGRNCFKIRVRRKH